MLKTLIVDMGKFNAYANPDPICSWHNHGAGLLVASCRAKGLDIDYTGLKYISSWEELQNKAMSYDIVGISAMSTDYPNAVIAAQKIKEVNPKCKIVVGGIHMTVSPQAFKKNKNIDYRFFGESEITFPKFLKNPTKYPRDIKGEAVLDLDTLPVIDRSTYPLPVERNVPFWGASPMISILTARGCPFNCSFCQPAERNHFGVKIRRRSVKNVIKEIKSLLKYGPRFIVFQDDHFMFSKPWLEEFINEYKNINLPFWAASRADFICKNPDMITKLREVGLEVCSIGFESGNQRILDMVRKGTTVEQNYQAAEIVGVTGTKIYANMMFGFPTETQEEQMDTRRLCIHISKVSQAMISPAYFTPYPGNDLGEECIANGLSLLDENNLNRYGRDKIKGVDYDFLDHLLSGHLDRLL